MRAEKTTSILEGAQTKPQDFLKQEFPQGWGKEPLVNFLIKLQNTSQVVINTVC